MKVIWRAVHAGIDCNHLYFCCCCKRSSSVVCSMDSPSHCVCLSLLFPLFPSTICLSLFLSVDICCQASHYWVPSDHWLNSSRLSFFLSFFLFFSSFGESSVGSSGFSKKSSLAPSLFSILIYLSLESSSSLSSLSLLFSSISSLLSLFLSLFSLSFLFLAFFSLCFC